MEIRGKVLWHELQMGGRGRFLAVYRAYYQFIIDANKPPRDVMGWVQGVGPLDWVLRRRMGWYWVCVFVASRGQEERLMRAP